MNNTYLGYLFTILSAAAFASTSLFAKLAYDAGMSAMGFTLLTSIFALVLLGFMTLREHRLPRTKPNWLQWTVFAACGAGAAIAFNVALYRLSISLGTILLFTYPAFVALEAWLLLGQRPSRSHLAALLLTLVGAVLTANVTEAATAAVDPLGMGLALLAAVLHGLYMVLGERVAGQLSAVRATTLTRVAMLIGTLVLSPAASAAAVTGTSSAGWLVSALCALVGGVAPFLFLNRGIALIGANRAAIVSVSELPVALALGLIFQGDVILPLQWAGAALITAAVVISQRQNEEESAHGSGSGTVGGV